jgi:solute carrier family 25 carnitine/acylcarnitine transporter 20/29
MPGVSGGVARIMVGQPFDTIKTRLQVLGKGTIGAAGMPPEMVYTSGMDCVRKMVSADDADDAGCCILGVLASIAHAVFKPGNPPLSPESSHPFPCVVDSCVQFKAEGPFSLYKGTVAPLLGNMVLLGIHFPTFHKTRDYLEAGDAPGTFTPWKILASGAAAGAAGSVVSSPTELIRTKMQVGQATLAAAAAISPVVGMDVQ